MFEVGGGKSATVILRCTPGASLFQSPIAALPVRSVPLPAAASDWTAMLKAAAMKSAEDKTQTAQRFSIHVSNRFGLKGRVDSNPNCSGKRAACEGLIMQPTRLPLQKNAADAASA